ncbi:MAG: TonB-dependent receptor, partial [Proteobacteria bacterium]
SYSVASGNRSLARFRSLVVADDYGRNSNLQSNLTNNPSLVAPGFGSVPVPCTSGFYDTLFAGDAPASADCTYAASAPLQSRSQNQQDITELNFQGGLFSLPAGQIRAAFGAQYRRNAAQFNPDILQSTASLNDQVVGLYPTGYLDAQIKAKDYYAEALVPVLEDTFVKKVELEIGGRFSDYDITKDAWTYKVNGNVEINDWIRLRGGYNRATRSPNLGELYLPLQELFGAGGYYGDPCGLLSTAPYGAAGAPVNNPLTGQRTALASGQSAAGANSTYLICRAQMGAGATPFYNAAPPAGTSFNGAGFTYQQGNRGLESEIADTWTAGIVLRSPFESALLNRITATVDWYQIAINNAILPYTQDYARYQCYGTRTVTTDAEARAAANSAECQAVLRDTVAGGPQTVLVSYANLASVRTSGVDFTVDWRADFGDMGLESIPGGIGLNVQGTWLDYYRTKQSSFSFDPLIEWKGSIGPNVQGFNAGAYEYRLLTSLSYNLPTFNVSLRWRHLPSVVQVSKAQEQSIEANNARVAAGGAGSLVSFQPTAARPISSYDVFDLSGFWSITDRFTVRFGVDNVFGKNPPPSGSTNGFPYDPNLTPTQNRDAMAALCTGRAGCVSPATYSQASSGQGTTSGGYYDTVGRRYYVGLKARF